MNRVCLLVMLALAACSAPTEIVLVVSSDLPLTQLSAVEIAIGEATDDMAPTEQACVCVGPTCNIGPVVALPLEIPLRPGTQGSAQFTVAVTGHAGTDCTDNEFVENVSSKVMFQSHRRLSLAMELSALCVDVTCENGEKCDPATGQCITSVTMLDGDMSIPPITGEDAGVHDMRASPIDAMRHDLAVPTTTFPIVSPPPSPWAITSDGVQFHVAWITTDQTAMVDSPLPTANTTPRKTVLPAPGSELCLTPAVAPLSTGGMRSALQFFVAVQAPDGDQVIPYSGTGSLVSDTPYTTDSSQTIADVQCAPDQLGVTIAWQANSNIIDGTPPGTAYVGRYSATQPVDPMQLSGAMESFQLALGRPLPGLLMVVPTKIGVGTGPGPAGPQPAIKMGGCATLTEYTFDETMYTPTSSCVKGDQGVPYAMGANANVFGDFALVNGVASAGSPPSPTPLTTPPTTAASAVAMTGTSVGAFLFALIDSKGNVELYSFTLGTTPTQSGPLLIATGAETTLPVAIAYSEMTKQVLVAWVDAQGTALMGDIRAAPSP